MLVALSECLQFSKPGIESHSWMIRILSEIQICCSSQLLLDNKSLLQQLQSQTGTGEVKYRNTIDFTTRINCKISGSMYIMMLSNTTIFSSFHHFSQRSFGKSVINRCVSLLRLLTTLQKLGAKKKKK